MARQKQVEEPKKKKKVTEEKIDVGEIKKELTDYMSAQIDKEVSSAVDKATKKLIRHKNIIIIKRDITILILLIICFFLGYNLYNLSNINIDITKTTKSSKKVSESVEAIDQEKTNEEENNLKDLTEKYGYLVDNIYVDEDSDYLKDYYDGKLTDELKLYLSLNNVQEEKIATEEDTIFLDENDLKEVYDNILDSDFNSKSFKYGNLNFRYLNSKSLFIADGKFEKQKSNISKEIISIDEDDNKVKIVTVEGLIKNNKLYNITSNTEIKKYNSKSNLSKYKNYLTKVSYYFNKIDDNYKLTKIEI